MSKKKNIFISLIIFICLLLLLTRNYYSSKTFYNILGNNEKIKANVRFIIPILNQDPYQQFNIMLQNGDTVLLGGEKEKRLSLKKGDRISIEIEGRPILGENENEKYVTDKALNVELIKSNIVNDNVKHDDLKSPKEDIMLEVLEDGKYYIAITNFSTNYFFIESIKYGKA
ncbi:hypothetical protein RBU61_16950 [Tissierella sp. MB52-C2]|uniref:hypothetical protein n=1 Tax=Tissierella sp. MB52-C2 TaxID=3070999 RepID=UPI00280BDB3D|nr:hypothetical protein [Tissierella sp. MB52-C2]WMM24599.1 hypothetical protein RBU61_16950 [Tissierella sp. MB52-C2]